MRITVIGAAGRLGAQVVKVDADARGPFTGIAVHGGEHDGSVVRREVDNRVGIGRPSW